MTEMLQRDASEARLLTAARVAQLPAPGMDAPVQLRFTPNGRSITYLFSEDRSLTRQLYVFNPETGEQALLVEPPGSGETDENLSREEALRRERRRERGLGVTAYAWSSRNDTLLIPNRGALYVRRGDGPLQQMVGGDPPCIDPRLSDDGASVAFVRAGELYSLDLTIVGAQPVRLTFDASPVSDAAAGVAGGEQLVTNGLAEFVAQEEMGREHGLWWSPDARSIAFEQVDSSVVPPYTIVHQGEDAVDVELHRYPFAGGNNVAVRLGCVPAAGGDVTWLRLDGVAGAEDGGGGYLGRVDWTPDGKLLVQLIERDQRTLTLRRLDPLSGLATTLLTETSADWLNLHDDLRCVRRHAGEDGVAPDGEYELLWSSEQSGLRQLYLCDRDGHLVRQLTHSATPVDRVVAVDERRRLVYFLAGGEGALAPLEMQLYRVALDGGEVERLSAGGGRHSAVFSPRCDRFVEFSESVAEPPRLTLRTADGEAIRPVFAADRAEADALGLRPPELIRLQARDGETLFGAIYSPARAEPGRRFPVLVSVYGGPHVQLVQDDWSMTADLRAQYLAQQGFIVFKLDNRGSARRGHRFEAEIFRRMGGIEVDDQVDGVRFLTGSRMDIGSDPERVGVYGWSYGGYLTLMCLVKAPDLFKAGVAGAPVTSWDGYDTFYTERYMETPQANPGGYHDSAVMTHTAALRGQLLLLHGMLDENVHFRHTARLINALNVADRPYELALFPSERHGPRSEAQRAALERRLLTFFREHL